MIIWGFRVVFRMLSEGTFFCPQENLDRNYKLKSAQRFFTIFFIPIIPLKKLGNVVECQTCKNKFDPQVLEIPKQADVSAGNAAAMKAAALAVLRTSTPTDKRSEQALSVISHYLPGYDAAALTADLTADLADGGTSLDSVPGSGATSIVANVYEKEGMLTRLTLIALGDDKHVTDAQRNVLETIGSSTFDMTRPHIQGTIDSVVNQVNGR
jgi:hypothetical protein